jgi:hypothetical protein
MTTLDLIGSSPKFPALLTEGRVHLWTRCLDPGRNGHGKRSDCESHSRG